jgi:hypothetical protein
MFAVNIEISEKKHIPPSAFLKNEQKQKPACGQIFQSSGCLIRNPVYFYPDIVQ